MIPEASAALSAAYRLEEHQQQVEAGEEACLELGQELEEVPLSLPAPQFVAPSVPDALGGRGRLAVGLQQGLPNVNVQSHADQALARSLGTALHQGHHPQQEQRQELSATAEVSMTAGGRQRSAGIVSLLPTPQAPSYDGTYAVTLAQADPPPSHDAGPTTTHIQGIAWSQVEPMQLTSPTSPPPAPQSNTWAVASPPHFQPAETHIVLMPPADSMPAAPGAAGHQALHYDPQYDQQGSTVAVHSQQPLQPRPPIGSTRGSATPQRRSWLQFLGFSPPNSCTAPVVERASGDNRASGPDIETGSSTAPAPGQRSSPTAPDAQSVVQPFSNVGSPHAGSAGQFSPADPEQYAALLAHSNAGGGVGTGAQLQPVQELQVQPVQPPGPPPVNRRVSQLAGAGASEGGRRGHSLDLPVRREGSTSSFLSLFRRATVDKSDLASAAAAAHLPPAGQQQGPGPPGYGYTGGSANAPGAGAVEPGGLSGVMSLMMGGLLGQSPAPLGRRASLLQEMMAHPGLAHSANAAALRWKETQGEGVTPSNLAPAPNAAVLQPAMTHDLDDYTRQKSRRSSFVNLFSRKTHDGELPGAPPTIGLRSSGPSMDLGAAGPSRRSLMIDIFSSGRKALSLLRKDGEHNDDDDDQEHKNVWYESLDAFKPLSYRMHTGRLVSIYFAIPKAHSQHLVLKKYDRGLMTDGDHKAVRRAVNFARNLQHEHLLKYMGYWETDETVYVVEEYASKNDLQQDSLSHPERYTERYMALNVIKPLLEVLDYLHSKRICHRSVYPENVLFDGKGRLRLGHLTTMIDLDVDPANERIDFLDYMAPEMLSLKSEEEKRLYGSVPHPGEVVPPARISADSTVAGAPLKGAPLPAISIQAAPARNPTRLGLSPSKKADSVRFRQQPAPGGAGEAAQDPQKQLHPPPLLGEPPFATQEGAAAGAGGARESPVSPPRRSFSMSVIPVTSPAAPAADGEGTPVGRVKADSALRFSVDSPVGPPGGELLVLTAGIFSNSSPQGSPYLPPPSCPPESLAQARARVRRGPRRSVTESTLGVGKVDSQTAGTGVLGALGLFKPATQGGDSAGVSPGTAATPTAAARRRKPPGRSATQSSLIDAGRALLGLKKSEKESEGVDDEDETESQPRSTAFKNFFGFGRAKSGDVQDDRKSALSHISSLFGGSKHGGKGPRQQKDQKDQQQQQAHIPVAVNPWEWGESYDEKVDIWQVGCLLHEVMCGCLPFETEDKLLASALILWADLVVFPDNLSPELVSFIRACLTKDPLERPSASELLQHDWIQLQLFDPELKLASQRQIDEGEGSAAPAGVKDALLRSLNRARSVSGMFARRSTNMSITSMGAPAAKPTLWGRVAGAAMGWFTGRGGGAGGGLGGGGDGGAGAARGAGRGGGKRGGVLPTSVVQVEDYHRSFHWAPSQGALTTRSSGLNLQPQAQQQQQQQQQQAPMTPLVKRTASEHSSKASREVGNREGTGATPSEVGSRVNIFGIPGL